MPILKKAPKKADNDKIPMHHVGDEVTFEDEGETYTGTISKINKLKGNCVVDVGEDAYEVDLDELQVPEHKAKVKAKIKPKGKGKGSSLVAAFNAAKAAPKGGAGLPEGSWEALVVGASIDRNEEKGDRGILEYCIVNEAEDTHNGKIGKTFYGLTDPDGEVMQGMEYFKRDLGLLGIDIDQLEVEDDDELDTLLETLASEEPWVTINVQPQKSNPQYKNIFLNGLMEDQEDKPERPAF